MKAVVIREHGGLNKLLYEDVPKPEVHKGEVLIRVKAAALNHMDLWLRDGLPKGPGVREVQLPLIPGGDIAGIVADKGKDVKGISTGTSVAIYPGLYCGECGYCHRGEHTMCMNYRPLGETINGGLAEYLTVPHRNVELIQEDIPLEKVAAVPVVYTTAWRMLMTTSKVQPGEDVLILGVGGGIGSASLQIASRIGAHIFCTSGQDWKLEKAKELGADEVLNYNKEPNFDQWVLDKTNGRGVQVVVDPVGAKTWPRSIRSLSMGGRMVICGATTGDKPDISIREIYQNHRTILGTPLGNQQEFRRVLHLVERNKVEPIIHKVLPLKEIKEAHQILEENKQFGKVVLVP